ncbi:hypothetical protein, conserved [Eimeria tenella]|uniref:Phosphatidic acid phosphatase type 2/haloperoxidase domain-containing protein n=1 Tax=Eimeria tenella TaxID=5802 RepID=U6L1Q0_EIMTE|nr:hypothetical protein, conserved [Eimeria tenella]CDJ41695.1 hypothetical protein, conserved [Eimeria tenella]|eukprot:XP_013232445.1 hypothetical protein, conserved [Eimeria tenella]
MDATDSVTTKSGVCGVEVDSGVVPNSSKRSLGFSLGRIIPSYPVRVVMHVLSLLAVCLVAANSLTGTATIRGSFCNNTDIALPKRKGSINLGQLMTLSFVAPSLIIILVELLIAVVRVTEDKEARMKSNVTMFGWTVPQYIVDMYKYLGGFGFTMATAWLFADSLKCFVGSLRPHFFDACKPDWSKVTCKGENGEYIYVEDFHCTNDPHRVEDARRSFPSGHSTYTMCGMLFGVLYLQARFRWHQRQTAPKRRMRKDQGAFGAFVEQLFWVAQALVPILQAMMLLLALYVPATRVLEHFHHVRDVCTGMLLGGCVAIFGAFFIIDLRD